MATRTAEREQFLADIIIGAVEGGTGYWAVCLWYRHDDEGETAAVLGEETELIEYADQFLATYGRKVKIGELIEAGKAAKVTVETVAKGLGRIKRGEVGVRSDILEAIKQGDAENDGCYIDADGADVIVQAGLFGEVVYG
jgi:hypothetical protein